MNGFLYLVQYASNRRQHGCWQKSIMITNQQFPRWNIQLQRSVKIFLLAKDTCNLLPSAFRKFRTCFNNLIVEKDMTEKCKHLQPKATGCQTPPVTAKSKNASFKINFTSFHDMIYSPLLFCCPFREKICIDVSQKLPKTFPL